MKKISGSVGFKGINRKEDVTFIQGLLNVHIIPGVHACIVEDGIVGDITISRIKSFQKHFLGARSPDGRVDVGGATLSKLLFPLSAPIPPSSPNTGSPLPIRTKPESVDTLSISVTAKELLKIIESLAEKPYDDRTGGAISEWNNKATIGYGHLIRQHEWDRFKNGISKSQAESLLKSDLMPFIKCVRGTIRVPLSQNQFDALVILAFNIGDGAFSKSSLAKMINDPLAITPYKTIELAWKTWRIADGAVSQGLINRRNAEWDIFEKNIYKRW